MGCSGRRTRRSLIRDRRWLVSHFASSLILVFAAAICALSSEYEYHRSGALMVGLNAITFVTTNMAAAVAFWRCAGLEVAFVSDDQRFTSLKAGQGTFVNLSQESAAPAHGMWGRAIIHVTNPDATHAAMTAAGYAPHDEPRDAAWGERYFHITDPDGNEISFARVL